MGDRMAALDLKASWIISLNAHELNLVLAALGGRLREEQGEHVEAEALGLSLAKLKANGMIELAKQGEKLQTNIAKGESSG